MILLRDSGYFLLFTGNSESRNEVRVQPKRTLKKCNVLPLVNRDCASVLGLTVASSLVQHLEKKSIDPLLPGSEKNISAAPILFGYHRVKPIYM